METSGAGNVSFFYGDEKVRVALCSRETESLCQNKLPCELVGSQPRACENSLCCQGTSLGGNNRASIMRIHRERKWAILVVSHPPFVMNCFLPDFSSSRSKCLMKIRFSHILSCHQIMTFYEGLFDKIKMKSELCTLLHIETLVQKEIKGWALYNSETG